MKELTMKERNELGDYFEDDNYHSLKNLFMLYGYFGIPNKVNAEDFYEQRGYGLNPKNFKPEIKKGDVYYSKLFEQKLTIDKVQDDTIFVDYEDDSSETYTPTYAKLLIERGDWIKVLDEEKEGGTEEDIKKAIAALEILAEDGDEDAKKGIEALKILLN
jgi:hypothetical protein